VSRRRVAKKDIPQSALHAEWRGHGCTAKPPSADSAIARIPKPHYSPRMILIRFTDSQMEKRG
jgi:hypothetical protein